MPASVPTRSAAVAAALAAALCLAGCGGDDKPAPPAAAPATAAPATTAAGSGGKAGSTGKVSTAGPAKAMTKKADPAKTKQAESSSALADGTYPVYLDGVNSSARTLLVDVVQYFEGDAAVEAARQDNNAADIGDDDYYIRNVNSRVRTLPVDPDALFDLFVKANGDATEVRLPELASYYNQHPETLFWVEVAKGKVTYVYGGNG
jgi:hypothetical protein